MFKVTFRKHFYKWDGHVYRQVSGEPIGLQATGPVSRILMDFWPKEILKLAERNMEKAAENPVKYKGLEIHMLNKYVDDCISAMKEIKLGVKWSPEERTLMWHDIWEKEDRDEGVSREVCKMKALSQMATSVLQCLKFTFD